MLTSARTLHRSLLSTGAIRAASTSRASPAFTTNSPSAPPPKASKFQPKQDAPQHRSRDVNKAATQLKREAAERDPASETEDSYTHPLSSNKDLASLGKQQARAEERNESSKMDHGPVMSPHDGLRAGGIEAKRELDHMTEDAKRDIMARRADTEDEAHRMKEKAWDLKQRQKESDRMQQAMDEAKEKFGEVREDAMDLKDAAMQKGREAVQSAQEAGKEVKKGAERLASETKANIESVKRSFQEGAFASPSSASSSTSASTSASKEEESVGGHLYQSASEAAQAIKLGLGQVTHMVQQGVAAVTGMAGSSTDKSGGKGSGR